MAKKTPRKVAFVSSFRPKRCGIATFTSDLITSIRATASDSFEPLVVAMRDGSELQYCDPVKFEIRRNFKNDYICAADYINFSHVDVVSVQHEFGLFGGDAGSHLNFFLRRVNAPVITTLHTVLCEPDTDYYQSMMDLCQLSQKLIVMNNRGAKMLHDIYRVPTEKIEIIPHGMPDLPFVDSSYYKHKFNMEERKTILTFGLLSKNKGIEMMLKALPAVVAADPSVLYVVLGATHPSVVRHDGEAYRFSLTRMVAELGLQDNVIFHNRFVDDRELHNFLCAADIYVTPSLNKEQLASGTLAFAVGTGKAVISTPYWAAEEMLEDGRGKLVPFGDSKQLADSIIEIIKNDSLFYLMRRKAYEYGRNKIWNIAGKNYWKLFGAKHLPARTSVKTVPSIESSASILEVPEPPLIRMQRLTDDTGLYQHAKFTIPDRKHGYCTDDNARAVVAMTRHYAQYADPEALRLLEIYLSFVCHAQHINGSVSNFMSFDRNWLKNEPDNDALARTLWAFGEVMAKPPLPRYIPIIKDRFDRSVRHIPNLSPRGKAYSIFGLANYLSQFPGASDIKRQLAAAADHLVLLYETNSQSDWQWFEDILTYDNAALVNALFTAAITTGNDDYLEVAERTCRFLLDNTFDGEHFSFIGCNGWYKRGGQKARFDQQPLEASSTSMMLKAAYEATGNPAYRDLQTKAFNWFLGENDLHIPVYDFRTKGCSDGLEPSGLNLNQGAESLLSFLLSQLSIVESYSTERKTDERISASGPKLNYKKKVVPITIEDIARKNKPGNIAARKE